jgi:NAD(P)-dependent dehydrogenase (short-subunit alcohol dehydrogenase family)
MGETRSGGEKEQQFPPQHQSHQPGRQKQMTPEPVSIREDYTGSGKLRDKVALISGGDSGIGRAVARHFAREGAAVAFIYRDEDDDAAATIAAIEADGGRAMAVAGDCGDKTFCLRAVQETLDAFGQLDILVNNAAEQHVQKDLLDIDEEQLRRTFTTNIFGYFFLTQAALPHLGDGAAIINTGSVTSFKGNPALIDYTATKGAIQAFTLALARSLAERNIRVNEVAPGPIWTPLIPASFSAEEVAHFGSNTLMGRAGQPCEVAPAYVFLASADGSFITGQVIHVNGGGHFGV